LKQDVPQRLWRPCCVQDVERALGFYEAVFGMVAVYRQDGIIQAQTPGSRDVLVFDAHAPRAGQTGGIAHFGFRLVDPADIDLAIQAVKRAGGPSCAGASSVLASPMSSSMTWMANEVEIWYELPTPIDPHEQR
jgi:predicted enzyme related to lactoylglutathione lyase